MELRMRYRACLLPLLAPVGFLVVPLLLLPRIGRGVGQYATAIDQEPVHPLH